jgi:hypothetical protein
MFSEFKTGVRDRECPAIVDLSRPGKPLVIAFGGLKGAMGVPPFEFFKLTDDLQVNKIFLRDLDQSFYHSGLLGISEDIDGTVAFLKQKIDESGADKVVLFGNSMGGYAALLFGILLGADTVHAVVPQTYIHESNSEEGYKTIEYVCEHFSDQYFDLKDVIRIHGNSCELNIHFDSNYERDHRNAMHLKGSQNVILHAFDEGGHNLAKEMKKSGKLREIIISSLDDISGSSALERVPRHQVVVTKLLDAIGKVRNYIQRKLRM